MSHDDFKAILILIFGIGLIISIFVVQNIMEFGFTAMSRRTRYRLILVYLALFGIGKYAFNVVTMPYEVDYIAYCDIIDIPSIQSNRTTQVFWTNDNLKKISDIAPLSMVNSQTCRVEKITYKTNYRGIIYPPKYDYNVVEKDKKQ